MPGNLQLAIINIHSQWIVRKHPLRNYFCYFFILYCPPVLCRTRWIQGRQRRGPRTKWTRRNRSTLPEAHPHQAIGLWASVNLRVHVESDNEMFTCTCSCSESDVIRANWKSTFCVCLTDLTLSRNITPNVKSAIVTDESRRREGGKSQREPGVWTAWNNNRVFY